MRLSSRKKPRKNAKKDILAGSILEIIGALTCIGGVISVSIVPLCIGSALISAGNTICSHRVGDIMEIAEKPDSRYDSLEYHMTIATPIATAVGAAARVFFGNTALFVVIIVIVIVFLLENSFFIGTVEPNKTDAESSLMKTKISAVPKFIFRPRMLVWMLCGLVPLLVLPMMESYVLPVFTETMEYSDIIITTLSVGCLYLSLYALPFIRQDLNKKDANRVMFTVLFIIAVAFILFSRRQTMESFAIVIIAIYLFTESMNINVDSVLDDEPNPKYVNKYTVSTVIRAVIEIAAPSVLSVLLLKGEAEFGLIMGLVCLICAAVWIAAYRPPSRNLNKTEQKN